MAKGIWGIECNLGQRAQRNGNKYLTQLKKLVADPFLDNANLKGILSIIKLVYQQSDLTRQTSPRGTGQTDN